MKRLLASVAVALSVFAAHSMFLKASVALVPSGLWVPTGDLAQPRAGAAAALLADGFVLVTGGSDGVSASATVDRYSAFSGTFAATSPMHIARASHTATRLDNGRVLVVGGIGADGSMLASAELYDPYVNVWTAVGSLAEARAGHTATLLPDGTVLIAGGQNTDGPLATLEVFSPLGGSVPVAAPMSSPRTRHAAALAGDKVWIIGGWDGTAQLGSVDVYDPETGSLTAGPAMGIDRAEHSATTLLDGNVLVAGGMSAGGELLSAEVLDLAAGQFVATPTSLSATRRNHLALLLPHNNSVLITGGWSGEGPAASSELFRPWQDGGRFLATGGAGIARNWGAGSALSFPASAENRSGPADGLAVVAGGTGAASAELYGFATVKTDKDDYLPGMTVRVSGSGWQPNQPVTFYLRELPAEHYARLFTIEADGAGNIDWTDLFLVEEHHLGVHFLLTAGDGVSQAQTAFTDGNLNSVDLSAPTSRTLLIPTSGTNSTVYTVTVTFGGNSDPCTVGLGVAWPSGQPVGVAHTLGASSLTNTSGATTTLTITVDPTATPLAAAGFRVTATKGSGCSGGQATATRDGSITLAAATLNVRKIVVGGTGGSDKFNLLIDGVIRKTDATNGEETGALPVTVGSHTVSEAQGNGGSPLTDYFTTIDCGAAGSGVAGNTSFAVNTPAGSAVTCTITNTKRGRIIVDKVTDPTGSPQSFDFTTTGTGYSGFNLTNAATPNNQLLAPGTYTVSEVAQAGWNLTSATCSSSLGHPEVPGNIDLNANETVTCIFTNTASTGPANQTIIVDTAAPANATYNTSFSVAAHATSGLDVAITVAGDCSITSGGTNTATIHMDSGTGTCSVHYNQGGNASYNPAPEVISSTTAQKADASCLITGFSGQYSAGAHGATGGCTGVDPGGAALGSTLNLGASYTNVPGGTAHWTFEGGINYLDEEGDVAIEISQAGATCAIVGFSGPYSATAHGATGTCTGVDAGGAALGSTLDLGASYTNVPGGTAHWTFEGGINYLDEEGDVAIEISQAGATCAIVGFSGPYSATAHGATGTCTGVDAGGAALGSTLNLGASYTNVPGGTAHWTFEGGINYLDEEGDVAIEISQADATCAIAGFSGPYSATAHGATGTCTGVDAGGAALGSTLNLGASYTNVPGGTAHWTFEGGTNYLDEEGDVEIQINPVPLSITADSIVSTATVDPFSKIYDGLVFSSFTARYDGFVGGEGPGVLAGALSFSGSAVTATNPGVYVVTPGGQTSINYAITFVSGSLTIRYGTCSAGYGPGGVILQPINSDGTSVFQRKGGSTIPVKFTVCDASGNPISNPAAVFGPSSGTITLLSAVRGTVDGAVEGVEVNIPDAGFRWSGDKWIFNMATSNLSSGLTYTFRINLAYGYIDFSVKLK